jgi:hypothetical protein
MMVVAVQGALNVCHIYISFCVITLYLFLILFLYNCLFYIWTSHCSMYGHSIVLKVEQ